jgi:hypothetical protein
VRKHRAAIAVVSLFAFVLLTGSVFSTWLAVRATNAERLARDRLHEVEAERTKLQTAQGELVQEPDLAKQAKESESRQRQKAEEQ